MPKVLTRLKITEVSAVDRGAGKNVKILLMKRDASKRKDKPMSKFWGIFGAPNQNTVIANATTALAKSVKELLDNRDDGLYDGPALDRTFSEFQDYLEKNVTAGPARDTMETPMLKELAKALGLKDEEASEADVIKALKDRDLQIEVLKAGFNDEEKGYHDKLAEGEQPAFRKLSRDERTKLMHKRDDLPEHVRKQLEEAEEMKKRLAKLEEQQELSKFEKIARDNSVPTSEATALMKLSKSDPEALDRLLAHTKAGWAAAQKAGVFGEIGTTGGNGADITAYGELMAKAAEYRKLHPELTEAQAFEKVYTNPANVTLAKRERMESAAPVMNPPGTMR